MTTGLHEPDSGKSVSARAEDWVRQCVKHFDRNCVDESRLLTTGFNEADLQLMAVRALFATLVDSGMDAASAQELFAHVASQRESLKNILWSEALNERRFVLIDKEIQGELTPTEKAELAGLTRIMLEQVESEANLPMTGIRELHQKLLLLEPTGGED